MIERGTQEHFQRDADGYYERNYEAPRSRHQRALALRRDVCLELLSNTHGRILDLGSGPGALAVPLARRGDRVVALDLSHAMVVEARRAVGTSASCGYVVGDACALPFRDASFDAVVTTGVLEYVPDVRLALDEIQRILVPGGTLVATVSLPRRLERAVIEVLGPLVMRLKSGGKPTDLPFHRAFTAPEFDRVLVDASFHIDARRFSCFAPFPLDAIWPPLVTAIDRRLGAWLTRVETATNHAKTYIVSATRP